MIWYNQFKLEKEKNEYILVIYLNPNYEEFSNESLVNIKNNILKFDQQIKNLVKEKFPDIKVNCAKLILGTLIVATVPFTSPSMVEADSTPTGVTTEAKPYYITKLATTGLITASKLNVRTGPSTSYSIIHVLWYGNNVKVIGESGDWIQIQLSDGRIGWVSRIYIKLSIEPTIKQQQIDKLMNTAYSLIGTPYVWGGKSLIDGGFDCSGFTQYVYNKVGISLSRISKDQATQGTSVTFNNLQPGDLVFYSFEQNGIISHVGIYVGQGRMIHSPKSGDTVKFTDITTSYWQSRFITARRIIQ